MLAFNYPKPVAVYASLGRLAVVRGPAIAGVDYFTTTRQLVAPDDPTVRETEVDPLGSHYGLLRGVLPQAPVHVKQVHEATVVDVDKVLSADGSSPDTLAPALAEADAMVTTQRELPLLIKTADCMPIVLVTHDAVGQARGIAVIHAGWRSLLAGIIEKSAQLLQQKTQCPISTAWIGPAIGAGTFEVGAEVREAFGAVHPEYNNYFTPKKTSPNATVTSNRTCDTNNQAEEGVQRVETASQTVKYFGDLIGIATHKLATLARQQGNSKLLCSLYFSGLCTYSLAPWFYSYRRDGQTGRLVTVAYLR